jgi:hypothetical protein
MESDGGIIGVLWQPFLCSHGTKRGAAGSTAC